CPVISIPGARTEGPRVMRPCGRSRAVSVRRRKSPRSSGSCAVQTPATSPARAFTPTAAYSWRRSGGGPNFVERFERCPLCVFALSDRAIVAPLLSVLVSLPRSDAELVQPLRPKAPALGPQSHILLGTR